MADYGLAAQIGRGNAMGGQQPDPTNRMVQMMQMQQLQQNMLLAREQEARAAALAPLSMEEKRAGIKTEGMRQGLVGAQTRSAGAAANVAEMELGAKRGVVSYLTANSANPRDPKALATLAATNPLAHDDLIRRFGETDAISEKARKEGALSIKAQNELAQAAVANMSWTADAIENDSEFQTLRRSLVGLDPTAANYIPEKYDGKNGEAMRRLRLRLKAWEDTSIDKDEQGRAFLQNKRTGGRRYLPEPEPAIAPPAAPPQMGLAPGAFATPAVSAQDRAGIAAGTAMEPPVFQPAAAGAIGQPPGAGPIILPRAGLSPKAEAVRLEAEARARAEAGVKRETEDIKKQEGRRSVQETLSGMIDAYKNLGAMGELQRKELSVPERLRIAGQARLPSDVATAFNFEAGSELTTINNLRESLIPVLTEVMGAKSVDAASESQRIINSLTTGGQSPEAIARTLTNFSKKYGLGVTFKPEDLAYTPPASPAGAARGRAVPATPQAAPAAAAGQRARPATFEAFLAEARPANPNASDADLRAYYNRTYGGQ